MSRHIVEIIREQVLAPDTPEYVLMNRDDIALLLALVQISEDLALYVDRDAQLGFKKAKELVNDWRELFFHEV